jgi:hypothetical protein
VVNINLNLNNKTNIDLKQQQNSARQFNDALNERSEILKQQKDLDDAAAFIADAQMKQEHQILPDDELDVSLDEEIYNQSLTEQEQQTQNKPYYDNFNNNVNNITELTDINGDNVKVAIDEVNHLVNGNQWKQRTQQGLNLRHNVLNNITNLFKGAKKHKQTSKDLKIQLNNINNEIRTKNALLKNNKAIANNINNNVSVGALNKLTHRNINITNKNNKSNKSNNQIKKEIRDLKFRRQKLINKLNKGIVDYSYYTNDIGNGYSVRFDVENMQDGTKQLYNFNVIDNNTGDVYNQMREDEPYNQMYENTEKDIKEFVNKQNSNSFEKDTFFNLETKEGLKIKIPNFTINHTNNKHQITSEQWQDITNNLDNIEYAVYSNKKTKLGDNTLLLKIGGTDVKYCVTITIGKNGNYITTAFTDNENSIDSWMKQEAKVPDHFLASFGFETDSIKTDSSLPSGLPIDIVKQILNKTNQKNTEQKNKTPKAWVDMSGNETYKIFITEYSDVSSIIHEFSHIFKNITETLAAKGNIGALNDVNAMNDWLDEVVKDKGEYRSVKEAKHEYFAKSAENYFMNGVAPNEAIKGVFDRLKAMLKFIYKGKEIRGVVLNDQVKTFFNNYIYNHVDSEDDTYQNNSLANKKRQAKTLGGRVSFKSIINKLKGNITIDEDISKIKDVNELKSLKNKFNSNDPEDLKKIKYIDEQIEDLTSVNEQEMEVKIDLEEMDKIVKDIKKTK